MRALRSLCAIAAFAALSLPRPSAQGLPGPEPPDPDTDRDGLSDFQELHKYVSDPANADSDGDGIEDGGWDERREFAYTVRTVLRVVKPVDVAAASDDYQDARLVAEGEDWAELEVIHYPLGTAADAVHALPKNPDWRADAERYQPYLESTTTSRFDQKMRKTLLAELGEAGVDVEALDDRGLALAVAERLMSRSTFEDGFTTFFSDFRGGKAVVPPDLRGVIRDFEQQSGRSIEEQWRRELFADGMFEQRVHGTCTSTAIYLCGGLRAAGLPARIVLVVPLVDGNDPAQIALVRENIRHHQVRATALKGLHGATGWSSHTFNEVLVGGRWRRLNYTRLGQPILDEGLFGLTTHVLTLRDWADARMGLTVGKRQGLGLRDEVLRTSNPFAALEVSDEFGVHAKIENPPVEEPKPLELVTIARAFWVASAERPRRFEPSGIDLEHDRLHIGLAAETEGLPLERDLLDPFWDAVEKRFWLVPTEGAPSGDSVPATAVRGMWWGKNDEGPFLYYVLKLQEKDRARLVTGRRYALVPVEPEQGCRFAVADGVSVVVPK